MTRRPGSRAVENLKISTEENFCQTKAFIGHALSRPAFEAIRAYTERFYARNVDLINSQLREQRIRDCHGDLHLEHIHLSPAALSIYDRIACVRGKVEAFHQNAAEVPEPERRQGHTQAERYFRLALTQ